MPAASGLEEHLKAKYLSNTRPKPRHFSSGERLVRAWSNEKPVSVIACCAKYSLTSFGTGPSLLRQKGLEELTFDTHDVELESQTQLGETSGF